VLNGLELIDELRRLFGCEPPTCLALVEPHRASGIAEVGMASVAEQLEELFHLTTRCGRTDALTECHVAVWPAGSLVGSILSSPTRLRRYCE